MSQSNSGCLGIFLAPFLKRREPIAEPLSDDEINAFARAESLPYAKCDNFLSAAEISFFHVLKSILTTDHYLITKVNLADLFYVKRPHENKGARGRISQKHVDSRGQNKGGRIKEINFGDARIIRSANTRFIEIKKFDLSTDAVSLHGSHLPMPRKISAIAFMLVMTLLITLKHPVLGYCLCLDAYFTGDCTCQSAELAPAATKKLSNSCCASCAETTQQDQTTQNTESESTVPTAQTVPCDECTEYFNLDVGDFLWASSDQIPADSEWLTVNTPAYPQSMAVVISPSSYMVAPIRGDPPPGTLSDSIPRYLRHAELRL